MDDGGYGDTVFARWSGVSMNDAGVPYPGTPEAELEWHKNENEGVLSSVREYFNRAVYAYKEAEELIVGRNVRILSAYNGQPHGRSKPSMLGEVRSVDAVHFDMQSGVSLKLKGCRLYIPLEEVELA